MRAIALSVAVMLSGGGFVIACPEWTHDLGLDVWNCAADSAELAAQKRRSADLHEVGNRVLKRIELKDIVVEQILRGQIGLEEATDKFQALNELDPELTTYLRNHFPGRDDREKTAHQVINFVKMSLADRPGEQSSLDQRLEAELQEMMAESPSAAVQ